MAAFQGPAYGLSRECMLKAQAKFEMPRAVEALDWIRAVTQLDLEPPHSEKGFQDQLDFADVLKDGTALCTLINILQPGAVPKINTMKAPFKQRENLEMFLKACESYGLKSHDLFQVNDLYERKNLYMVVNCMFALGGLVSSVIGLLQICFIEKVNVGLPTGCSQMLFSRRRHPY